MPKLKQSAIEKQFAEMQALIDYKITQCRIGNKAALAKRIGMAHSTFCMKYNEPWRFTAKDQWALDATLHFTDEEWSRFTRLKAGGF